MFQTSVVLVLKRLSSYKLPKEKYITLKLQCDWLVFVFTLRLQQHAYRDYLSNRWKEISTFGLQGGAQALSVRQLLHKELNTYGVFSPRFISLYNINLNSCILNYKISVDLK